MPSASISTATRLASRHPAPPSPRRAWLTLAVLLVGTGAALAQSEAQSDAQQRLQTRSLAATCAHCHGTDGRAVEGQPMIRLAGLPADYTLTQLMAFRSGQRPATVMHQLSRGYSPEQLEQLAKYFAAIK